jgi:hypothetical protein
LIGPRERLPRAFLFGRPPGLVSGQPMPDYAVPPQLFGCRIDPTQVVMAWTTGTRDGSSRFSNHQTLRRPLSNAGHSVLFVFS